MTSTTRVYAVVAAVLVFFVAWAAVAAHPWQRRSAAPDPRVAELQALRLRLARQSVAVQRILDRRFAAYAAALRERRRTIALVQALNGRAARAAVQPVALPAPAALPTVSALPAVTATRTS